VAFRSESGFVLSSSEMKLFLFGLVLSMTMAFLSAAAQPEPASACLLMPSIESMRLASSQLSGERTCMVPRQSDATLSSKF
jgi:hypothetical protein